MISGRSIIAQAKHKYIEQQEIDVPNWLLWDRVRALSRAHKIYQGERVFQDQYSLDRLIGSGDFFDWNSQQAVLDQTSLFIHRLERYRDYDAMDQGGVMSLVYDLYADETSLVDPERKHTIIIRAKSKRIKTELEDLFFNALQWDRNCRPAARYLSKYGDCPFEIVPTQNRDGVGSIRIINVYNFTRVETRHGDLVGFYYQDELTPEPMFLHPWQVAHMRLASFESVYNPYGRSISEGSRKPFKQLRLMEDSALIYRITRGPEKRKFKIPVGNIPPKEIPEYLQMIARTFKRRRFYNPMTGSFDERYSPLIQEDDFILPVRPDGSGPDIETMEGGKNLNDIEDIEYFKKAMVAPTKIPFSRVGIGEGAGEAKGQSVSQEHNEFAKAVQWVQREMASGLMKIAIVHLMLRGFSVEDIKSFEIALTSTSAVEELYRIEAWQTRVDVMTSLKELGWFPKEWIVTHFTDLTPDELEEIKEMTRLAGEDDKITQEGDGPAGGGGGGGGGDMFGNDPGAELGGAGDEGGGGDDVFGGGDEGGGGDEMPADGEDLFKESRVPRKFLGQYRRLIRRKSLMHEWADRRSSVINNPFDHTYSNYELDGLSKETYSGDQVLTEDSDPTSVGIIVPYKTDFRERKTALEEARNLIVGGNRLVEAAESSASQDITDDDIPFQS